MHHQSLLTSRGCGKLHPSGRPTLEFASHRDHVTGVLSVWFQLLALVGFRALKSGMADVLHLSPFHHLLSIPCELLHSRAYQLCRNEWDIMVG